MSCDITILDNGYQQYERNPYLDTPNQVNYMKWIRDNQGEKMFALRIHRIDFRGLKNAPFEFGYHTKVQFNTGGVTFNVDANLADFPSLAAMEVFYQNIFHKMECD